jgi:hypothetical protein
LETDITQIPEVEAEDYLYTLTKAGIGILPLGGTISELMSGLITPSIERRRNEWMKQVAIEITLLKKKQNNFKFEDIKDNETFTTTFLHATQTAMKNHQKEKLESLKNTILNSTQPNSPDEDLQLVFINYIDAMTQWHLRILKLFDDPIEWFRNNNLTKPNSMSSSISQVIKIAFPELNGKEEFKNILIKDLDNQGLSQIGGLNTMMSENGAYQKRTTSIGQQFIKFISSPL